MVSEFVLLFGHLNLLFFSQKKKDKVISKIKLAETKAIKFFEYEKDYKKY